ncbi:hypothetical protein EDC04DRAFT_2556324 [Pisolithus marmoratus]|nr:hypothetical protein EDC04DRAFT_2556324 [Pisolithus marmoratus]
MKAREYCCCAIPLVNPGIYAVLTEQFVLGVIVGTLSVATPSIVGAATPSVAPWLFAIICYVGAAVQILGFLGVAQEKPIVYRRYVTLHSICTCAAFAMAATWIIVSAVRHSTAQSNCEDTFFPSSGSTDSTSTLGQTMCNIFPWVDVGLMGAIWVFFAGVQGYFYFVVSSYGTSQRQDHEKYEALNDSTKPLTDDIPMADRGDPWDSRASQEFEYGHGGYGHSRNTSTASTVVSAPPVTEAKNVGYGDYPLASYAPHERLEHQNSRRASIRPSEVEPSPYTEGHYARRDGARSPPY